MTHETDIHRLLAEYADGELSAEQRAQVEALLREQPEYATAVERWRALRRSAGRAVHEAAVPAGLAERIRSGLAEAEQPAAAHGGGPIIRLYRFGAFGLAAAAVLMIAVFMRPDNAGAADGVTVEARGFADVYRNCALQHQHDIFNLNNVTPNVRLATLEDRAAVAYDIPDLAKAGFHVAGACKCPPKPDLPALHVHFRTNEAPPRVVSVFVIDCKMVMCEDGRPCDRCPHGCRKYLTARQDDLALLSLKYQDHSFVFCGQMPAHELTTLVDDLHVAQLDALREQAHVLAAAER
jgi:anti-sigma factor RsiW